VRAHVKEYTWPKSYETQPFLGQGPPPPTRRGTCSTTTLLAAMYSEAAAIVIIAMCASNSRLSSDSTWPLYSVRKKEGQEETHPLQAKRRVNI